MKRFCLFFLPIFICLPMFGQQPGDALFSSSIVHDIRITFTQAGWWDTLTSNYTLYNSTNLDVYIPGNVLIDGNPLDSIGVKLKGNSSYNNPGMKKPMKLSFDEYHSGQRYDGLKSFFLENSAYDPTMLREKLMLDVLHRHNLPAPRCTFAAVFMNGTYIGLYKIIESIDKTFLQSHFNYNDGNLFKGDPNGTLQWKGANASSYYGDYELKTNNAQNNWSDLIDLIDRINNYGAYFPTQIQSRFDVDSYLWSLAADNIFVNLDSYLDNPHNYYVYDDSLDGKFHWINWDVGLSFGVFPLWMQNRTTQLDIFYLPKPSDKAPLNVYLFQYDVFRQIYLDAMCTYYNEDFNPQILYPKIDSLANVIRPYVYAEPESNRMYTTDQFEGNLGYTSYSLWIASNIPGLKSFVSERRSDVAIQLCNNQLSCAIGNAATEVGNPAIRIFPNPSNNSITIFFDSPEENSAVHYSIFDMLGNKIFDNLAVIENGRYEQTLDFTTKASGVYILKVESACSEIEQKIVIVH